MSASAARAERRHLTLTYTLGQGPPRTAMNKDKQPKPSPQYAGGAKDGPWVSAFEAQSTPTVHPPAVQLSADPVQGDHCTEEADQAPETVVFDIGGFADPQNPAGGGGKGIKVVVPPGLDGPTALVHVVMAMLRCTEAEAKVAIEKEHMQWTNYRPEGHGTDRAGNIIHLMRFKPKYAERTAHEPATLRPAAADELARYKAFKLYLLDHGGDNIRDPYAQYDSFAQSPSNHFFIPEAKDGGSAMFGAGLAGARGAYEDMREAVVQYVVWERLRAKREGLADGIGDETTSLMAMVGQMADRFPSMVDMEAMQYYMPDRYFTAWNALHARMIVAQGALEQGDASPLEGDLCGKVYQLAYWFADFAEEKFGVWSSGEKTYHKFTDGDVLEIHRLTEAKELTMEQGLRLMLRYYKLTFAMMEVAGRSMAHGTEKTMLQPHGDGELNLQGRIVENQGKVGTAMLGLMHEHPSTRKVNAIFYPEQETKDFREGGEKSGGDDWSEGIPLDLYLWHDAEAGEWVLEDFTDIDGRKENRADGAANAPVPAALFEELDSKLRFPKGALYYRCPDEASYRIMRTTEPTTLADWLRMVAMAGLAVGLAVATMGASIPAQVVMIGSAVAMAGAEAASMRELHAQGMLDTERVVVHGAMIASCILGGASGALGMLGKAGWLAEGSSVVRVVAGLQVGADGICVAVFTKEAFAALGEAADDPEGMTFTRLLAFFLQMGMNGLMLYGMRGSMREAAGMGGGAGRPHLEAKAKGAAKQEAVPLSQQVEEIQASLLARVGGDLERAIKFTEAEITEFVAHSQGLGFGRADIEAMLIVKMRKPKVGLPTLKDVASSLAEKARSNDIGFLEGWDFMRAYRVAQERMLHGGVLEPSEYLLPSYIEEHLHEFSGNGSYLVTGVNYFKFVKDQPAIGFPDGQYLSTVERIDEVLTKANGDIAIVEKQLGIPEGWWQNQKGLYRVDVSNAESLNLRIPNGNEIGANEFWCPGGSTSGGVKEAFVNRIPAENFKADSKPVIE
jgi:hypothetical protein